MKKTGKIIAKVLGCVAAGVFLYFALYIILAWI